MSSGLLPLGLGLSVWPLVAPFCALKVVVAYVSLISKKAPGLHLGLTKKTRGYTERTLSGQDMFRLDRISLLLYVAMAECSLYTWVY